MASLPPLSSEVFAEKVLDAQANSSAVAAKASYEKICTACQKSYYSENAFQNHLGSQKHRLRAAAQSKKNVDEDNVSVISSTISLGEPISSETPKTEPERAAKNIDPVTEAEFSQVIDGMKDTDLSDREPILLRAIRPHHSAAEKRTDHPLFPEQVSTTKVDQSAGTEGPPQKCLFCNYTSPTFKLNVMHMTKYHSMFIPEQTYLVDLEGLISWLHARIHKIHECLYCHKTRGSAEAIQTHMRDVGHCKIAFEEEQDMLEVGQFYDFSSTYSDPEHSDEDDEEGSEEERGGVRVPDPWKILKTTVSNENGEDVEIVNGEENNEGWETDSSASSVDTDEITAVPIDRRHMYKQERLQAHRHHSHDDPRPHRNADGFHSHAHSRHAVFHSDHELHLPSGRTAGHRSLNRYYRQNLHNHPSAEERIGQHRLLEEARSNNNDGDSTSDSSTSERGRQLVTRANGGLGMLGVTDAKKKEVQAAEKRDTKRAQRAQKQYRWRLEKRANNQKHFRDPLLQ